MFFLYLGEKIIYDSSSPLRYFLLKNGWLRFLLLIKIWGGNPGKKMTKEEIKNKQLRNPKSKEYTSISNRFQVESIKRIPN